MILIQRLVIVVRVTWSPSDLEECSRGLAVGLGAPRVRLAVVEVEIGRDGCILESEM